MCTCFIIDAVFVSNRVFSHPLSLSGSARGRWYKFNDNVVEEFDMNDETLEYECFGGEYRPKVYDQCKWRTIAKLKKYVNLDRWTRC